MVRRGLDDILDFDIGVHFRDRTILVVFLLEICYDWRLTLSTTFQ